MSMSYPVSFVEAEFVLFSWEFRAMIIIDHFVCRVGMILIFLAHMKAFWNGNTLIWIQLTFYLRFYFLSILASCSYWSWAFNISYFCGQIEDDNRHLLFLHERGKKKLMEGKGSRVVFRGQFFFFSFVLLFSYIRLCTLLFFVDNFICAYELMFKRESWISVTLKCYSF